VRRVVFRLLYGVLLIVLFLAGAWLAFQRSIVGRAVPVPDLTGKSMEEAFRIARGVGLRVQAQADRARSDDRMAKGRILLQQPEGGSLAKPSQIVRVVLSLGPREVKVPDLTALAPRAAAFRLAQESLQLGAVSWYRDTNARVGIVAQDPEPETPSGKNSVVDVLTNRGVPEKRYVMPELVGHDAEKMRMRLETYGLRVGSARYETYEGIAPNTVLKQFPPAGYPISSPEVVSLTVSRAAEVSAPVPLR
jgi:beta-lactam-binding protein with PASTA domain